MRNFQTYTIITKTWRLDVGEYQLFIVNEIAADEY